MKYISLKKLNKKIVKVITTLTLIIVVFVNCIVVFNRDNNDIVTNAAEFSVQEVVNNACEFHFTEGGR